MSEKDKSGLVVLLQGLAVGVGFVWLFGFAVGYSGASWVACGLLGVGWVGLLVLASRLSR